MGANVSREMSINEEENGGGGLPRSATLPSGFKNLSSWSGTLGRGLGLDTSFTVKLTKSKKLDGDKSELDETKVEIVAKEKEEVVEEDTKTEETMKEFIEAMLVRLMQDALENVGESKMKKSTTLPHGFKGLAKISRSHSFGKRIRQSIRKLVPAKKIAEEEETVTEDDIKQETDEVKTENIEMTDVDVSENSSEEKENAETEEVNDTVTTTNKNNSFMIAFKNLDLESKKKKIQVSLKKLVTKTKRPKKETLQVVNSIIDDIIKEVEGEEEEPAKDEPVAEETVPEPEEVKEVMEEKKEVTDEDVPTGVLDKSND